MAKSPYKILNEYEEEIQKEFDYSTSEMLKAILIETEKEFK